MATDYMINPQSFLAPQTLNLEQLLTSSSFVVPKYQRSYSWKSEQVTALWNDLRDTAEGNFHGNSPKPSPIPHFMGPLVLEEADPSKDPEVMDGQQRLVTFTALLSVLSEFIGRSNHEGMDLWGGTINNMLFQPLSGKIVPRLRLAKDDDHYQNMVVQRKSKSEREKYFLSQGAVAEATVLWRLNNAMIILWDNVNEYVSLPDGEIDGKKLIKLIKSVLQLTVFLQMKVQEQGVAYEVFEGLNARGLDLQQADLVKNRLFSFADAQGTQLEVEHCWLRVEKSIESQNWVSLTEFLFFNYIAVYGTVKQTTLYSKVKAMMMENQITALDYARSIAASAESLQLMLDAGSTFSEKTARYLTTLRETFNLKYSLVPLMAGATKHKIESLEQSELIRLTHNFVFRHYFVEKTGLTKFSSEIGDLSRRYAGRVESTPQDFSAELNKASPDATFMAKFSTYTVPNNKMGFYIVEAIENMFSNGAGVRLQPQSASQHLEHIMPRNPGSASDWSHVSEDPLYKEYTVKIGNLLVLEADINSSIKNTNFADKTGNAGAPKKSYAHSKMKLPSQINEYAVDGVWDFSSIDNRQVALSEHAVKIWSLQAE